MYRGLRPASPDEIWGTIDEEIWDVICFALAIANCYGIGVESAIARKEAFNAARYPGSVPFEMDR
ncbi:MAG: hypothetical protein HFF68_06595 [Oscillospiraceae bacterium]|jgi:hypothetical protein|nr:hypothetical protein [Oscillospiraceae bacterium]MCI8715975.1 hypothetical protein [Oscillospiraceae bacterium]